MLFHTNITDETITPMFQYSYFAHSVFGEFQRGDLLWILLQQLASYNAYVDISPLGNGNLRVRISKLNYNALGRQDFYETTIQISVLERLFKQYCIFDCVVRNQGKLHAYANRKNYYIVFGSEADCLNAQQELNRLGLAASYEKSSRCEQIKTNVRLDALTQTPDQDEASKLVNFCALVADNTVFETTCQRIERFNACENPNEALEIAKEVAKHNGTTELFKLFGERLVNSDGSFSCLLPEVRNELFNLYKSRSDCNDLLFFLLQQDPDLIHDKNERLSFLLRLALSMQDHRYAAHIFNEMAVGENLYAADLLLSPDVLRRQDMVEILCHIAANVNCLLSRHHHPVVQETIQGDEMGKSSAPGFF